MEQQLAFSRARVMSISHFLRRFLSSFRRQLLKPKVSIQIYSANNGGGGWVEEVVCVDLAITSGLRRKAILRRFYYYLFLSYPDSMKNFPNKRQERETKRESTYGTCCILGNNGKCFLLM